jgi:hypothetical protein
MALIGKRSKALDVHPDDSVDFDRVLSARVWGMKGDSALFEATSNLAVIRLQVGLSPSPRA